MNQYTPIPKRRGGGEKGGCGCASGVAVYSELPLIIHPVRQTFAHIHPKLNPTVSKFAIAYAAMVTTIQSLPDELLVEILGKLYKDQLKTARLTCSLWSTASARWMFQRVYFAPREAPMKTFLDIAASPAFTQNVEELIYDARLFLPELRDPASYSAAFRARVADERDIRGNIEENDPQADFARRVYKNSIWNTENLGHQWDGCNNARDSEEYKANVANSLARYTLLLEQQETTLKMGMDLEALCQGFKVFRNIRRVHALVDFNHTSNYCRLRSGMADWYIDTHDCYAFRSNREFGLTVPPSKWWTVPRTIDGGEQDQEEISKWDVRGIQNLFRAVSTDCRSLKELSIASRFHYAPMTIFQLDDADSGKLRTMAHRLTTLSIDLYVAESDDDYDGAQQLRCLDILLQEAKELRVLAFSRPSLDYDDEEGSEISDVGSENSSSSEGTNIRPLLNKSWPHLSKLDLGRGSMKATDLMSIFQANKGSLHHLKLESIFLLDENWEDFGKGVAQVLELHTLWIADLHDANNRRVSSDSSQISHGDQTRAWVQNLMGWVVPDQLEIKAHDLLGLGMLKTLYEEIAGRISKPCLLTALEYADTAS